MQVPLPLSDRGCRCQSGITSQDVPGSLRGTGRADVALEDRPRAGAVAVGVREEGGDGFLGGGRVIIEPARKPEQFSGIVRKDGNGTIMDQAEPTYVSRSPVNWALLLSGCNSHPATGSLQPVAIGAMVEATKPSEPARQRRGEYRHRVRAHRLARRLVRYRLQRS